LQNSVIKSSGNIYCGILSNREKANNGNDDNY
jgi:hypothetical protein